MKKKKAIEPIRLELGVETLRPILHTPYSAIVGGVIAHSSACHANSCASKCGLDPH
jgi:hypothetical protein